MCADVEALSPQQRVSIHAQIGEHLLASGAHLVIEGVWDLPQPARRPTDAETGAHLVIEGVWDLPCAVQQIEERMLHGETPLM